jgi:hypothetical protein
MMATPLVASQIEGLNLMAEKIGGRCLCGTIKFEIEPRLWLVLFAIVKVAAGSVQRQ